MGVGEGEGVAVPVPVGAGVGAGGSKAQPGLVTRTPGPSSWKMPAALRVERTGTMR